MRYRVEFRYREDTGEVEMLRVDAVETGQRAADHDARHDRVTHELASVVEEHALVEEIVDDADRTRRTPGPGAPPGPGAGEPESDQVLKRQPRELGGG